MQQSQRSDSKARGAVLKLSSAGPTPAGPTAVSASRDVDGAREARIRAAAYALYEARGQAPGHDVDDWLAAEAALAAETGPAPAGPRPAAA